MTICCSATIDRNHRLIAKAWPFAAGLLLLAAATGLARAQAVAEAPRVPFSLAAPDARGTAPDPSGEFAGLGLVWHPGPGLDIRGEFRAAPPAATSFYQPGCLDGSSVLGCGLVYSPALSAAGGAGVRETTIGGQWQPLEGLRFGVDLHSNQTDSPRAGALLLPRVLDFIAPGWEDSLSRGVQDGEGVDLSVAYGFDAGVIGELELQVELSHVLNQNLERFPRTFDGKFGLVGQPENQASVGFNWTRGDFSGSVSSRYTDGIMLNGQVHPAAWTTVDINFAWRTPWNASLSLGAQNFLGQERAAGELGMDVSAPPELDSAFSRVPYVRYEQDL